MAYLLASAGGALGALARWGVAEALPRSPGGWPWSTLAVNLAGCLLIGLLLAVVSRSSAAWASPFLGVGVLGGFTTYSAFAVEVLELAAGAPALAAGYITASVAGGVLAVAVGLRLGGAPVGDRADGGTR